MREFRLISSGLAACVIHTGCKTRRVYRLNNNSKYYTSRLMNLPAHSHCAKTTFQMDVYLQTRFVLDKIFPRRKRQLSDVIAFFNCLLFSRNYNDVSTKHWTRQKVNGGAVDICTCIFFVYNFKKGKSVSSREYST